MWIPYLLTSIAVVLMAFAGGYATDTGAWYRGLKKPRWNPPNWSFGVIWTLIYVLIVVAVGKAWNSADEPQRVTFLWLTGINFFLNGLWSFVFFRWQRLGWALLEMSLLWLSIVVMIVLVYPYSPVSGWLLFPYLLWVTIAFCLNTSIYLKNR